MNNIIEISNLNVTYPSGRSRFFSNEKLVAVDDVSLNIAAGSSTGIAGESGSGKSTIVKAIGNLLRFGNPGINMSGEIHVNLSGGTFDTVNMKKTDVKKLRKSVQFVFQDPNSSLNPRLSIGEIIEEPLRYFSGAGKKERKDKAVSLLERTGLDAVIYNRYPHELSGGQKQRVGIARALAPEPEILIADEPLSSLDVSVQAQILKLFGELRKDSGLTLIFVSHDLSVIENICTDVAVMYMGKIMEQGKCADILLAPVHPYTKALVASVPVPEYSAEKKTIAVLKGDVPSSIERPKGCVFNSRCPLATEICHDSPPLINTLDDGRNTACHNI